MRKFLAKCPNIKSIEFPNLNDSVLDIIGDCCPQLMSLTFDCYYPTLEGIKRFGHKMGPKLKHIDFNVNANANQMQSLSSKSGRYMRNECQTLLSLCPNVESLAYNDFLWLDFSDKHFVPKLRSLGHSVVRLDSDSDQQRSAFGRLADKYEHSLREMIISFQFNRNPNVQSLAAILRLISRFTKLDIIYIRFDNIYQTGVYRFTSDSFHK